MRINLLILTKAVNVWPQERRLQDTRPHSLRQVVSKTLFPQVQIWVEKTLTHVGVGSQRFL